jgi:hypothetical protein
MVKIFKPKISVFRDYHRQDGSQLNGSYWKTNLMPGFSLELNSPKALMIFDYEAGLSNQDRIISSSGNNDDDSRWDTIHNLTVSWDQYLTRSIQLEIRDRFAHEENPVLTHDDRVKEVLRERLIYDQNDGYVELSWNFGIKDRVSLVYQNRYFDIQDKSTVYGDSVGHEGSLLLENWLNSKIGFESFARFNRGKFKKSEGIVEDNLEDFYDYEGGVTLNYFWHPNRRLFIKYNALNKDFDNFNKDNEAIDFWLHKGLMGLNIVLSSQTDIYLEGGYFVQEIHEQNVSRKNEGSIFKSILKNRLTKDFSFSMEGSGGYKEDYFSAENLGPSKFLEVFGSADYIFSKKFRINAYTICHFDDFLAENRKNKSCYSGTVFFFYLHNNLMLSVEFFHSEYESKTEVVENTRGNSIFIHLTWNHNIPF